MMRPPLHHMRIRENSSHHLYGHVRVGDDGKKRFHAGWDLAARPMTPVYAVADGTVRWIQFFKQVDVKGEVKGEVKGTYGRSVLLELDGNQFHGRQLFAFYAHLSHVNVGEGDHVAAGQQIALTGIT